jgi:hypothetical protein
MNLVSLAQINASLTVARRNLDFINGFPNATEVTVIGGSLTDLALKHYGDATKWTIIADANGITDPEIVGRQTLMVPPAANTPAAYGGGVDIDHWIGSDTNGMTTVITETKAQQRILRRLLTNPLDYVWHPAYGAGVLRHVGDTDANLKTIEGLITSQMLLEPTVAQIPAPVVTFDIAGDDVTANIQYTDRKTGGRQFLSFTVTA